MQTFFFFESVKTMKCDIEDEGGDLKMKNLIVSHWES